MGVLIFSVFREKYIHFSEPASVFGERSPGEFLEKQEYQILQKLTFEMSSIIANSSGCATMTMFPLNTNETEMSPEDQEKERVSQS